MQVMIKECNSLRNLSNMELHLLILVQILATEQRFFLKLLVLRGK